MANCLWADFRHSYCVWMFLELEAELWRLQLAAHVPEMTNSKNQTWWCHLSRKHSCDDASTPPCSVASLPTDSIYGIVRSETESNRIGVDATFQLLRQVFQYYDVQLPLLRHIVLHHLFPALTSKAVSIFDRLREQWVLCWSKPLIVLLELLIIWYLVSCSLQPSQPIVFQASQIQRAPSFSA